MREQAMEPAVMTRAADRARRVPSITVCLVTHNRPHYVRTCLESLRVQTVGLNGFDVIVVDSCGTPETGAALRDMVATLPNARLLRVDRPGASAARNLGAENSTRDFLAYLDDDALAMPDWVERIQAVIQEHDPWPGVLGGKVLPVWEKPLPDWWPDSLAACSPSSNGRAAVNSVRRRSRQELEPYGVNMVVQRLPLLEMGGFADRLGRFAGLLLSDEDVQVGWKLQDRGHSAWYDSRIVVRHQIQGTRIAGMADQAALLAGRLHRGDPPHPRRAAAGVARIAAPAGGGDADAAAGWLPKHSTALLALRWRLAYARASPGWR